MAVSVSSTRDTTWLGLKPLCTCGIVTVSSPRPVRMRLPDTVWVTFCGDPLQDQHARPAHRASGALAMPSGWTGCYQFEATRPILVRAYVGGAAAVTRS